MYSYLTFKIINVSRCNCNMELCGFCCLDIVCYGSKGNIKALLNKIENIAELHPESGRNNI